MSSVNGRLVTCDICGESVFLKCIGEGETDGGYTRWNKFEEAVGWSRHCYEYMDICPSCTERISNAVKDEIEGIRREKRSISHDD